MALSPVSYNNPYTLVLSIIYGKCLLLWMPLFTFSKLMAFHAATSKPRNVCMLSSLHIKGNKQFIRKLKVKTAASGSSDSVQAASRWKWNVCIATISVLWDSNHIWTSWLFKMSGFKFAPSGNSGMLIPDAPQDYCISSEAQKYIKIMQIIEELVALINLFSFFFFIISCYTHIFLFLNSWTV